MVTGGDGIINRRRRFGSLRYWYQRNNVDLTVSKSAVWNDDVVQAALDSAAFWVDGLPFVKSLSGYWKFFLAPKPANVPDKFYDAAFPDSDWSALPGSDCFCGY
ncbi:PREDICTED: uncharacterized protein LOC104727107 [Camelina sativa]|uniref:Uncharacterized protein LOC104727107 n=1 Tax=Camelina sativa TaxID=90675 RepID=A0ABM0UQ60_CAMSA|nr:PREDICTED: uncharacterized protein LOC104727107 [Camelina sativa]